MPAISTPSPAPGLGHAVQDARPLGGIILASNSVAIFFKLCIWNVHLSERGPWTEPWTEDGKRLTPRETFISPYPLPPERGPVREPDPKGPDGKSQERALLRESGAKKKETGTGGSADPGDQGSRGNSCCRDAHAGLHCGFTRVSAQSNRHVYATHENGECLPSDSGASFFKLCIWNVQMAKQR